MQKDNLTTRRHLLSFGFNDKLIDDFNNALTFGAHPTIDIFLEKKTNFRDLGSYLIASTLMPLERHTSLFPQRDWYGDLFEALDFESEEPDASLPSVVTLNYERSLEHFLNLNIKYNCQDERVEFAHEKRRKLRIVHAHGSLGKYPEVDYGVSVNVDTLRNAAAGIKIVSDRLDDSPDFQEAQELISKATHIVFLGFGYDERTLSALLAKTELDTKHFYGTACGIKSDTIKRLQEMFGNQMIIGSGETCHDFLGKIDLIGKGH